MLCDTELPPPPPPRGVSRRNYEKRHQLKMAITRRDRLAMSPDHAGSTKLVELRRFAPKIPNFRIILWHNSERARVEPSEPAGQGLRPWTPRCRGAYMSIKKALFLFFSLFFFSFSPSFSLSPPFVSPFFHIFFSRVVMYRRKCRPAKNYQMSKMGTQILTIFGPHFGYLFGNWPGNLSLCFLF